MTDIKKPALLLLPFVLLTTFIVSTNPYRLPLALLLVPFVLIGVGSFYGLQSFLRRTPLSRRKVDFIAGTVTSVLLLLVLLQSIRQLSAKDMLILLAFLAGITFYVRRIDV